VDLRKCFRVIIKANPWEIKEITINLIVIKIVIVKRR